MPYTMSRLKNIDLLYCHRKPSLLAKEKTGYFSRSSACWLATNEMILLMRMPRPGDLDGILTPERHIQFCYFNETWCFTLSETFLPQWNRKWEIRWHKKVSEEKIDSLFRLMRVEITYAERSETSHTSDQWNDFSPGGKDSSRCRVPRSSQLQTEKTSANIKSVCRLWCVKVWFWWLWLTHIFLRYFQR